MLLQVYLKQLIVDDDTIVDEELISPYVYLYHQKPVTIPLIYNIIKFEMDLLRNGKQLMWANEDNMVL